EHVYITADPCRRVSIQEFGQWQTFQGNRGNAPLAKNVEHLHQFFSQESVSKSVYLQKTLKLGLCMGGYPCKSEFVKVFIEKRVHFLCSDVFDYLVPVQGHLNNFKRSP